MSLDTSKGRAAHVLATTHRAALEPRLPAGQIDDLATDLSTLGAPPPAAPSPLEAAPQASCPSLAEAMSAAATLISAVCKVVRAASTKAEIRKAYGASGEVPSKVPKALRARGRKIITRAKAQPGEAASLGIMPADVVALAKALTDLEVAESAAKGPVPVTAKQRHAAEARMREAVTRISAAGVLAFAMNVAVRAEFEALCK